MTNADLDVDLPPLVFEVQIEDDPGAVQLPVARLGDTRRTFSG